MTIWGSEIFDDLMLWEFGVLKILKISLFEYFGDLMIWGSDIFDDFEDLMIWRFSFFDYWGSCSFWLDGFDNLMNLWICCFEDLDIYGFWGFGDSRIWRFELRILRALGIYGFRRVWFEDMRIWSFEDSKDLVTWRFSGILGFADSGILMIWASGDLRIWWFCLEELVNCEFWGFGNF